jgi:Na+-translocating ferredoxin:NAD+ oxidoreductase RnfG subunit
MREFAPLLLIPAAVVITAPAYAHQYLSVEQAQKALFPTASRFVQMPVLLNEAQRDLIEEKSGVRQRWETQDVWRAELDGKPLGWFIVDKVVGKHEFITYAAALSNDGKVLGVEVMIYLETYGDQIREASWRQNLLGKTANDSFKLGKDVPNISGATLSCRNVSNGVKRLLALQQVALNRAE